MEVTNARFVVKTTLLLVPLFIDFKMAVAVRGFAALQVEFEKAKDSLKDVDENIRKLTGRDPNDLSFPTRPGLRRVTAGGDFRGRDRIFEAGWRDGTSERGDGPTPGKRRNTGGAFSRLGPRVESRQPRAGGDSGDEDELAHKPTIQSSVVATPHEVRTRRDSIEEQKSDSKSMARNRRMFGLLLGTLQRFKDEEGQKKEKERKRAEIEKKLEEAAEKEKEELKKERLDLFKDRRSRQARLRMIEQKMDLAKMQEEWEGHHRQLLPHIQTKTKPYIFYKPAKMTPTAEERLKDAQKRIEEMILQRRLKIDEELDFIEKANAAEVERVEDDLQDEIDEDKNHADKQQEPMDEDSMGKDAESGKKDEGDSGREEEEDRDGILGILNDGVRIKQERPENGEANYYVQRNEDEAQQHSEGELTWEEAEGKSVWDMEDERSVELKTDDSKT